MTISRIALAIGLALAPMACGPAATTAPKETAAAAAPAETPAAPAPLATASGEVVVLQPEYGAVTIKHEAIPELGMGAMTMEFTVADPAQLKPFSVGDKVTFTLTGPTDIASITPAAQ